MSGPDSDVEEIGVQNGAMDPAAEAEVRDIAVATLPPDYVEAGMKMAPFFMALIHLVVPNVVIRTVTNGVATEGKLRDLVAPQQLSQTVATTVAALARPEKKDSSPAEQVQKRWFDRFDIIFKTGKISAGAFGTDQSAHQVKCELLHDLLDAIHRKLNVANERGLQGTIGRGLQRVQGILEYILGRSPITAPEEISSTRVMVNAMLAARGTGYTGEVDFGRDTLQNNSAISHMLAECLAVVAHIGSSHQLRVYLIAAHLARPKKGKVAHEDTPTSDVKALMAKPFAGSLLLAHGYADDYTGEEPWSGIPTDPTKPTKPPAPPTTTAVGSRRERDTEHAGRPPPHMRTEKEQKKLDLKIGSFDDDVAKCVTAKTYLRTVKTEPNKPRPTASSAGFDWPAKWLWPIVEGAHGPPPKRWAEAAKTGKHCLICGTAGHWAPDCVTYEGVEVGDPWWKLYEEAMNSEDRTDEQRCIPSERPPNVPHFFDKPTTTASKKDILKQKRAAL